MGKKMLDKKTVVKSVDKYWLEFGALKRTDFHGRNNSSMALAEKSSMSSKNSHTGDVLHPFVSDDVKAGLMESMKKYVDATPKRFFYFDTFADLETQLVAAGIMQS